MTFDIKTILDYFIVPTITYLVYLHKTNISTKKELFELQTKFKYQAQCCSDLQEIKTDVMKLLIYFDIEHKEKDRT